MDNTSADLFNDLSAQIACESLFRSSFKRRKQAFQGLYQKKRGKVK
jgi:hypothetical protein